MLAIGSPGICGPDVAPLDQENHEPKNYPTHTYSVHSGEMGEGRPETSLLEKGKTVRQ